MYYFSVQNEAFYVWKLNNNLFKNTTNEYKRFYILRNVK